MRLTFIIIGLCLLVFLFQSIGIISSDFAFMPATVTEKPYTLITSIFMHSGLHHLLLNMLGLFIFGLILEKAVGKSRWILLYLFSGLIASLGYLLLSKTPFIPALGASGAIFGLIGGLALLKPKQIVWVMYFPLPMYAAAILWGIIEFISLFKVDNIAHSAHLFGLIGGLIMAYLYKKKINWKFIAPLLIVPVVLIFILTSGLPNEIQSYQLNNCELNDSLTEINYKYLAYTCKDNFVLTTTSPTVSELNTAQYSRRLPRLTEDFYKMVFEDSCTIVNETVDLKETTTHVWGNICEYKFYSLAKKCDNVAVEVVQIAETEEILMKEIDCKLLKD